jgi:hypothetical protein
MRVGLVSVEHNNFPNLALMKLSAYHKALGDTVELTTIGKYDRIYMSKVFSYTKENFPFLSSPDIRRGGTGYGVFENLPEEIEHICPDYSLYTSSKAYGFLTRGCIRNCKWCVVPKKEGKLVPNADIEEFISDKKEAILMDNNVLASSHGLAQIEKIVKMKVKVDFNQGLDARIIVDNPEIAKLLAKVKWLTPLRMACDSLSQIDSIEKATILLREAGATPKNYFIYVLVQDIQDALLRIEFLRNLKLDPFAQPYRDFENNHIDPELKHFARWVNHKATFRSCTGEDYKWKGK